MTPSSRKAAGTWGEAGTVLVFVLWVLAILSMLAGYYALESRLYREVTSGSWFALKERQQVLSLLRLAGVMMKAGTEDGQGLDSGYGDKGFPALDGRVYRITFAGQTILAAFEDERGKLDLNRASEDDLATVLQGLLQEKRSDMAAIILDGVLDWRDNDQDRRPHGAEDDYYMGLDPPYRAANRKFITLDELLLVRGVSPDLFYGPLTLAVGEEDGRTQEWRGGLQDVFTIYNPGTGILKHAAPEPIQELLDGSRFLEGGRRPGVVRLKMANGRRFYQAFVTFLLSGQGGYELLELKELPAPGAVRPDQGWR